MNGKKARQLRSVARDRSTGEPAAVVVRKVYKVYKILKAWYRKGELRL